MSELDPVYLAIREALGSHDLCDVLAVIDGAVFAHLRDRREELATASDPEAYDAIPSATDLLLTVVDATFAKDPARLKIVRANAEGMRTRRSQRSRWRRNKGR